MITRAPKRQRLRIHDRKLDLSRVRWDRQTNAELSLLLGKSPTHVAILRRQHAPETVKQYDRNPARWDSVNWDLPNCEIAKMLGVSRQLVHITRRRREHRFEV